MDAPNEKSFLKLKNELTLHDAAMESTSCGISIADARLADMPLIYVNKAFTELSGYAAEEVIGKNCRFLQGDERDQEALQTIRKALKEGKHCKVLLKNYTKSGGFFWNELILSPIRNNDGELTHFVGVQNDVTDREEARLEAAAKQKELKKTFSELQETQAMLIHSEKMNAMGQMVAGVAHEINNPISFISSNTHALRQMVNDLKIAFEQLSAAVEASGNDDLRETAKKLSKEADFDFIQDDLGDLLNSSEEGLDRVKKIVLSLRNFSRLDEAEVKVASIKECLESTLEIAFGTIKGNIVVDLHLGELSPIRCRPAELNQVFLNLIMNASQATGKHGRLTIKGDETDEFITLSFRDNGPGMDAGIQEKIFNPFFTTKPVGEGTGLGLSIAHKIITGGHRGKISVESKVGEGTCFTITLPKV